MMHEINFNLKNRCSIFYNLQQIACALTNFIITKKGLISKIVFILINNTITKISESFFLAKFMV